VHRHLAVVRYAAALVRQAHPDYAPVQIRSYLSSEAIDSSSGPKVARALMEGLHKEGQCSAECS
jgi:hypothetical protein